MDKRILTCAVTGAAPIGKDKQVPVTPKEIADSSIGAAKAGAAQGSPNRGVTEAWTANNTDSVRRKQACTVKAQKARSFWCVALHRLARVVRGRKRWNINPSFAESVPCALGRRSPVCGMLLA